MKTKLLLITALALVSSAATAQLEGGYIPAPVNHHKYTAGHTKTETLPAKYDSRDYGYITTPRNQEISGPCWAFAACDALEAYSNKYGFNEGYYSPQLFTNCHTGFLWPKTSGGNSEIAAAMLARLEGPAYETSIPYVAAETECPEHDASMYPAYFLGCDYLPEGDTIAIKEAIMGCGAVAAGMHYESASYNPTTRIYCYTGDGGTNHGISIIGWDDEERVFLTKFNWYGTSRFDGGFLKISYDDTKILSDCYAFYNRIGKSEIDHVYTYSKTGYTSYYLYPNTYHTVSAITYFNAETLQRLTRVGCYVADPGEITFTVMMGTLTFTQTINCDYAGFYSVPTDMDVEGQFLVAVDYPGILPFEKEYEDYNSVDLYSCDVVRQQVQLNNSPSRTYDVCSESASASYQNINLCVYAYTQDVNVPTSAAKADAEIPETVIDGKVNPAVWESASEVLVYSLDGTLLEDLTSQKVINRKGLYIFVVRYSTGGVKRSLELLY